MKAKADAANYGGRLTTHLAAHQSDFARIVTAGHNHRGKNEWPHAKSSILAAAPNAPVVVKQFADSFEKTTLEETLAKLGATELLVCGMMTQNCVTHTAISRAAEKYSVCILADCCTTVDEMIHNIALHAVSTRVKLPSSSEVL